MSFLEKLKIETNITTTENGATTFRSTNKAVLDLFALGGAARNLTDSQLKAMIIQALDEDVLLATKVIFYLGDVREGQGERRLFKLGLEQILTYYKAEEVLQLVPEFTRWDNVIELVETSKVARDIVTAKFKEGTDALFFKWIPSLRAHKKINPLAKSIIVALGISEREYKRRVKEGRRSLNLVETNLTTKKYDNIDYNKVPSKAGLIYREAFKRHDGERYLAHVEQVAEQAKAVLEGKMSENDVTVKVNANVLYPHEVISKYKSGYKYKTNEDASVEALWYSLKNFLKEDESGILPVIDTSGSMFTGIGQGSRIEAIDVAMGFGMYFAERLKGPYKDHFINFSDRPTLNKVAGNSLAAKLGSIDYDNWGSSTNVQGVFDLILDAAIKHNVPQEELPSTVIIFSDMEFNYCGRNTNLHTAKQKFNEVGYELPNLVFWNICARNKQVPAEFNEQGVVLVSGYSPSAIKFITTGEIKTAYDLMMDVLNSKRYSVVDSFKLK